jgi:hypothetical protein
LGIEAGGGGWPVFVRIVHEGVSGTPGCSPCPCCSAVYLPWLCCASPSVVIGVPSPRHQPRHRALMLACQLRWSTRRFVGLVFVCVWLLSLVWVCIVWLGCCVPHRPVSDGGGAGGAGAAAESGRDAAPRTEPTAHTSAEMTEDAPKIHVKVRGAAVLAGHAWVLVAVTLPCSSTCAFLECVCGHGGGVGGGRVGGVGLWWWWWWWWWWGWRM